MSLRGDDEPADESARPPGEDPDELVVEDELIGLDLNDPETRAFADHLRRMRHQGGSYTVEGYVNGVGDFANSANRAIGHRRLMAVIVVGLILLGVLYAAWQTLVTVVTIFGR